MTFLFFGGRFWAWYEWKTFFLAGDGWFFVLLFSIYSVALILFLSELAKIVDYLFFVGNASHASAEVTDYIFWLSWIYVIDVYSFKCHTQPGQCQLTWYFFIEKRFLLLSSAQKNYQLKKIIGLVTQNIQKHFLIFNAAKHFLDKSYGTDFEM
jgi:hypothetical protein